jgi:2-keto-3-deoxy-L-rhamnonate aldolase RhmA
MALLMGRRYYGGPGTHPEVRALVDRAVDLILRAGKVAMLPAGTGAEARAWSERGVRLITMNFGGLVRRALDEFFTAYRGPARA